MGARSKGCHTCKLRKVRCDGTRPSCNRCGKLGNVCPGYENAFNTFIDEKPRIERAQAIARQQERESRSMQQNPQHLYRSNHVRTSTRMACCRMPGPSSEISLVGFKDGILLSFLVNKLQSGHSHCERLAAGSKTGPPPSTLAALEAPGFGKWPSLPIILWEHFRQCSSAKRTICVT
jgi:hypothetical protein